MARKSNYIEGFYERMDQICYEQNCSKQDIAERMGYDRKALYPSQDGWGALKLARFCAVTGADANWLLGLSRERKDK